MGGLANEFLVRKRQPSAKSQADQRSYFEKSKAVFVSNGLLEIPDNKWERALLSIPFHSIGDYTMAYGRNNSFLQNRAKSGERRPTWKLLLRGHMTETVAEDRRKIVMTVLDELDLDLGAEPSLDRVIAENVPREPWRQMLVQRAEHIAYCGQRMFRRL